MKYEIFILSLAVTSIYIIGCNSFHSKSKNKIKTQKNFSSGLKTNKPGNGLLASDYYNDIDDLLKGNYYNYQTPNRSYNLYNNYNSIDNNYPTPNFNQLNEKPTYNNLFNSQFESQPAQNIPTPVSKDNNEKLPTFLGGTVPLSNNQKSKTFRPVSPEADTTVDYKGRKYSKIYEMNTKNNVRSGYYGETRQT